LLPDLKWKHLSNVYKAIQHSKKKADYTLHTHIKILSVLTDWEKYTEAKDCLLIHDPLGTYIQGGKTGLYMLPLEY
jgi:hypothetical protein